MAKLDQILLKYSQQNDDEFAASLIGDNPKESRPSKIEDGELVIHQKTGYIELWALDNSGSPAQVSVDISGQIPALNPEELDGATLGNIGDVDLEDGIAGDFGSTQAGYLLTWDGTKWVARPVPGFEDGVISTLNDVGDVNYAFTADTTTTPKYVPVENDLLLWKYNPIATAYQWAPIPFDIQEMPNFTRRSGRLVMDRQVYDGIEFGNLAVQSNNRSSIYTNGNGGVILESIYKPGANTQICQIDLFDGEIELRTMPQKGISLKVNGASAGDESGGIYFDSNTHPNAPASIYHLTSLAHVRADWGPNHTLDEISDVNTTNLFSGAVLVWDAITSQWVPSLGPAPDLTAASINELSDVNHVNRGLGTSLIWNTSTLKWEAEYVYHDDVKPPYYSFIERSSFPYDRDEYGPECNESRLGLTTVIGNVPYICLACRASSSSQSNGANTYGWVKYLLDGYNNTRFENRYSPAEYKPNVSYTTRADALSEVAYEGFLGSLYNVSTANVFAASAIIYNPSTFQFEPGYPALDLSSYGIGDLGDVDATNASSGYGLLWDGTKWEASSLEQKVRLDDLQDVQFGQLGIVNTKLVGAWMLVDGDQTSYLGKSDLSATLSVSTPKADAGLGTTLEATSPNSHFYSNARFFGVLSTWTLAEKLDNYVRWNSDNSWQEIPGDGCIEIFFYPTQLLGTRTIFRKESDISANGGYIVQLLQTGALQWQVQGPTGYVGFTIASINNFVSLNNWHHLAITREVNTNRLYLDGNLVGSATSVTPWTGNGKFILGRNDLDDNNTLTHDFFRGYMQDLRVTRGRAKYTGNSLTVPTSLENEVVDTTPTAGDFLSYDGTKWTNVDGVTADLSTNSITELSDVDTTSQNPATGDALVWTGSSWEPGIPGVGATWALDDFTDVSTYYQANTPFISFDQAELIRFSTAFQTPDDLSYIAQNRSNGTYIAYYDDTNTCDTSQVGRDGDYANEQVTYFQASRLGEAQIKAKRLTIENVFFDCGWVSLEYHEDTLHYAACPDRSYSGPAGAGDIPGNPDETYVPCWGVIQDHMNDLLPYGYINQLGDVSVGGATNGQALVYNSTLQQWEASSNVAADISLNNLNDLNDVSASPSTGQVLQWNGSAWEAGDKLDSLFDISDVNIRTIVNSGASPHDISGLKDSPGSPNYLTLTNSSNTYNNTIVDLDLRGISFDGAYSTSKFYLYSSPTTSSSNPTTVLTSPAIGSSSNISHLEISAPFIRIGDGGGSACGSEGFRLSEGWKIIYEDTSTVWSAYAADSVPHKGAMQTYLDTEFSNLDLQTNSLDDLGDVDTTGKLTGYALIWDAANLKWIASASVAADISQSSIGQLSDVVKTDNSGALVNDGNVSFDIGSLQTSRPWISNGGLFLHDQDLDAYFGWSSLKPGAPEIVNDAQIVRLEDDRLYVETSKGIIYDTEPPLSNTSIPAWRQVTQQIVRQATDYTALFHLTGNDFVEQNYDWSIDTVVTTSPNPVYFSNFNGEYSYETRKTNRDRIVWTNTNGMPQYWNAEVLACFEFWFYVSSADAGDGYVEFLMAPAGNGGSSSTSSGLTIGINGTDRSEVFVSFSSVSSGWSSSTSYNDNANLDSWNHIAVQNEGSGRWRGYLNGTRFVDHSTNAALDFDGGIAFGGRQNTSASSGNGYFTGFIDDIRITKSWIPYASSNIGTTISAPVVPVTGNGNRFTYGTLNQLTDVDTLTTPPTNGQVLTWDNLANQWTPGSSVAYNVSANSVTDLSDVDTTTSTPSNDDILRWDQAAGEWRRSKIDGSGGVRPLVGRSATPGQVPSAGNLFAGELFLNMADKVLYALDTSGTAFAFAQNYDRVIGGTF